LDETFLTVENDYFGNDKPSSKSRVYSMRLTINVIAIAAIIISSVSYAENNLQDTVKTNRYTNTSTKLEHSQTDLLSVVITIRFPSSILTVGEAIRFVLSQSGYQLDDSDTVDDSQYYLYQLALPETHRYFDHVTLKAVLDVLANKSYSLVVNPVKRTISYRLRDQYKQYIDDHNVASAKSAWLGINEEDIRYDDKRLLSQVNDQNKLRHYGPVKQGESLSVIAHAINQYGVKADIVMVAIYLKNNHAFLNDSMHLLIEGKTLTLPSKDFVHSVSNSEAEKLILLHNKRWYEAYGNKVSF
jgi:type IV pili sensor histidine kinase/response regulator